jgi:hypothetical protein
MKPLNDIENRWKQHKWTQFYSHCVRQETPHILKAQLLISNFFNSKNEHTVITRSHSYDHLTHEKPRTTRSIKMTPLMPEPSSTNLAFPLLLQYHHIFMIHMTYHPPPPIRISLIKSHSWNAGNYPFPILHRTSSDSMIFQFCSDVGRRPTWFLLRLLACCRSLSDAFPHVVRTLANRWRRLYSFCFSMFFSFKTVG